MRVRTSFAMEGSDSEFVKFTVPPLKALLKVCSHSVSGNKQELAAHAVGYQKVNFFLHSYNLLVSKKKKKKKEMLFFHPPSPFPCNSCKCNSSGICAASQFYF